MRLSAVKNILSEHKSFEAAHRAEYGWRNVYVRKMERTPVIGGEQALNKLETVLGARAGTAPVLLSAGSTIGQVTDGFSVPLGGNITLYGYVSEGGIPTLGALVPGGHLKFPHPWPGQNPPLDSSGTAG